jgi:1-acyl-sn-glycerol-3-phosphate acyltransferase
MQPTTQFTPPSLKTLWRICTPLRLYFSPQFFGLEHIDPKRPALFVANHTIYGVLDVPLYAIELYRKKGIYLRGLADHFHYMVPGWRNFLFWIGAVRGTPENCEQLMRSKENIIVFPGGGREVCKRKGELYQLIWKKRTGFARLAIKHQYPIIPLASIGIDDAFSILMDRNDMLNTLAGKLLKKSGLLEYIIKKGEEIPAIARGIGLTPLPRPERIYVSFGKAIETEPYQNQYEDKQVRFAVREQVEKAINQQLGELLLQRYHDKDMSLLRRILNQF